MTCRDLFCQAAARRAVPAASLCLSYGASTPQHQGVDVAVVVLMALDNSIASNLTSLLDQLEVLAALGAHLLHLPLAACCCMGCCRAAGWPAKRLPAQPARTLQAPRLPAACVSWCTPQGLPVGLTAPGPAPPLLHPCLAGELSSTRALMAAEVAAINPVGQLDDPLQEQHNYRQLTRFSFLNNARHKLQAFFEELRTKAPQVRERARSGTGTGAAATSNFVTSPTHATSPSHHCSNPACTEGPCCGACPRVAPTAMHACS